VPAIGALLGEAAASGASADAATPALPPAVILTGGCEDAGALRARIAALEAELSAERLATQIA
jgi:hypothetical protein